MARYPKRSSAKLTDELIEKVSKCIKIGCYVETAAAICGISKDTFYRWLRNAKNTDASDLEIKLSDAVLVAMAESELKDLQTIQDATQGPNGWKAAAWRLERRFPQRWGKSPFIEFAELGDKDNVIEIEFISPHTK